MEQPLANWEILGLPLNTAHLPGVGPVQNPTLKHYEKAIHFLGSREYLNPRATRQLHDLLRTYYRLLWKTQEEHP
jgi:hypothetical protein